MKKTILLSLVFLILCGGMLNAENKTINIGVGGNAYITQEGRANEMDWRQNIRQTDKGIDNWKNQEDIISFFFHIEEPQTLEMSLLASGNSTIQVSCENKSYSVKLKSTTSTVTKVGKFKINKSGYVRIDIQGIKKDGEIFGNIEEVILKNPKGKISYVHDFSDYWGRRGPSVHMGYALPRDIQIEWFYNEVKVPKEGDVIGSYYMANGFGEGYFGIQNNSQTERRVLFSVWSPFNTDDPKSIPEDQQIKMLRRGEGVNIGEFGNEGSGGQSFLRYNWNPDVTYKFLTQVHPDGKGNTIYTAYFYATDENRWRLIASFLRPKTDTWYKRPHSFLENFNPVQGYLERSVQFSNQWARDVNGNWYELTDGTFTHDATASAGVRLDYQGGLTGNDENFYLKNGGFFNENTKLRTTFKRKELKKQPEIDFEALASIKSVADKNKTPLMGWSSWNTFGINVSENLVKETADAMVEKGLKNVGYEFVNIDDGYFAGRGADGKLINNDEKFPNGMKVVADYIHSKGLKAGIYSEAGDKTCAFFSDGDKNNGLNVGLYRYEEQDIRMFFDDWGYDFIKIDYCGAQGLNLDEETQYRKIYNAIQNTRKARRGNIRWNICRWMFPGTWATEIAGSWRMSYDIRNRFNGNAGSLGVIQIFEKNLYLSAYSSPGHFNDMDMMQIGRNTFTVDQEKSHFGLWSIMSSPLIIGCDLRTIPQRTLDIITNKEIIALNQDILGLQAQVVSRQGKQFVVAKMIEKEQGKVRAVALFNGDTIANVMRIDFKDIDLSEKAKLRDLWEQKDLGTFTGYYEVNVPAHGTAMLRVEGESSFDKTVFEGEDAFINKYNEILIEKKKYAGAIYAEKENASGGYVLTNIGGADNPDNWTEFRRVYSSNGGSYDLDLFFYSDTDKNLTISVNGTEYPIEKLNSGKKGQSACFTLKEITLKSGYNTIRFSNPTDIAPDIDKFIVKKN